MRLLISGFEPFAGAAVNPSALLARALASAPPPEWETATVILPVVYDRAWPTLLAAIEWHRPEVVLATGLAGGRPGLAIERFAVNLDDGDLADNAGVRRSETPIVAAAPLAYAAGLPVRAMAAAAEQAGVPARVSLSAGAFLCNHVFFRLCHLAATRPDGGLRCGFIHLPWLPEQAARALPASQPSLPLERMVAGVRAAIAALRTAPAPASAKMAAGAAVAATTA
jgi:pyroglutamyl-peptidase